MATCVHCGEPNVEGARFCSGCGSSLRDAVQPGFEVRKTVTVLFCDVVGSTALGEATDPETTRKVMARYSHAMAEIIERHGGTVEKFRGDEVMAVFGVPAVHEDDALRAVRAGMEMQRRLDELSDELLASWGVELACRIGINTGAVVAGDPGTGESFVTGDAVNLAKRLEQAAAPGDILIGTDTYPLVKDAVKVGPRERFSAKGKRDPVSRFRLADVDATAAGYARRLDAPLVGRDEELDQLVGLIERSYSHGRCGVVTVLGAAGIGKSRLAREVGRRVEGTASMVTGRCLPYGSGITFWPVIELVGEFGGIDEVAPLLVTAENGNAALERVRAAIGTADDDAPSDEVFWGIRLLLERVAAERPLVVCLEDLHWAEPTMLDLVEYLAAFAIGPLVLLCIARPELLELRPGFSAWPSLDLEQLSPSDTDQLVEALGVGDEGMRARITTTSEGNALFAEQLAAAIADSAPETRGAESLRLPASINALLESRLDRLEPVERRALERAAVIGKEFWQRAVADLSSSGDRPSVTGQLLALVRKGLIRPVESRIPAEDQYRFRHALIRDAAYAGMPKAVRADLHERFARWLQGQSGRGFGAHDEIVGYHLEQAFRNRVELGPPDGATLRLGEDAAKLLLEIGARAFAREDMPAAASILGRAALLLRRGDGRRLDALRDQAQALWESGSAAEGAKALTQLLSEAEASGENRVVALAELERIVHEQLTGTDSTAVQAAAQRAISLCTEVGDQVGLARAWRRMSAAQRRAGEYSAGELSARKAVEHARAASSRTEEARAIDGLVNCLLYGPTPVDEALATCSSLLEGSARTRSMEANVLGVVAGLEGMRGNFAEARDAYRRAAGIFEELGLQLPRAALTQIGAPLELLAGDPVAAEQEARKGAETFERLGSAAVQAPLVAEALHAQGRLAEAESELAAAPLEQGPELPQWQVRWRIVRARLLMAHERSSEATKLAEAAVELADRTEDLSMRGDALAALSAALAQAGRHDDAVAAFDALRALRAAKGVTAGAPSVRPAPAPV